MADTTSSQTWTSKIGFILASVGSAVGLGDIWKFPYMAGEGGGSAFLIPYILFSFTLGLGLLLAEVTLGKVGKGGIVTTYKRLGGPVWGALGHLGIAIGFGVLAFYSVVGGWCLLYLVSSFGGLGDTSPQALGALFGRLSSSPSVSISAQVGFLALVAMIVALGIRGGIEKCSKWLMPFLFFFILVLIVTGLSQPGSWKGVEYLLYPDLSKVSVKTLLGAMGLTFFSYSVGAGCMLTYGAYLDEKTNPLSCCFWTVTLSLLISTMSGLMILPTCFAFGMDPAAGPGLTFITMPAIFAQLPFGGVFAVMFFFCLVIAALTSAISMLEIDVTWLVQEFRLSRPKAVVICSAIIFVLSIPCALSFGLLADFKILDRTPFDLADFLVSDIGLPIGGVIAAFMASWVAWDKVHKAWAAGDDNIFWKKSLRVMIGVFCPLLVMVILLTSLSS